MKKFVGFGVMLALIVAPVAIVSAQQTVNLFPIAFGTFAGHDTYLAVTNLTQLNFALDDEDPGTVEVGARITIRSASQAGTAATAGSDLAPGETRVYASNSSVNSRNFGCTDDICTVTVCAPAVAEQPAAPDPTTPDPLVFLNPPAISSALFWLNNGQFYGITTPIVYTAAACPTTFGPPAPGTPPIVIP